jgi:hypothetical protein
MVLTVFGHATNPDFRGGHPVGKIPSESMSGQGTIHMTNRTTAPMSQPAGFVAGPNTVRTMPMTIAK